MEDKTPTAAGISSYDLIDEPRFWHAMAVSPGITALDVGCGTGRCTLKLAEAVGPQGRVIAVDLWGEGIERLHATAEAAKMDWIDARVADARKLPLPDDSIDLCLMATVLHDFVADGYGGEVLTEVSRVLKQDGILALVEFRKQPGPPGPPVEVRLTLESAAAMLLRVGLIRFSATVELGPHLYFARFRRMGAKRK
jgi:ubiquinone/menaquinone biosynthesis C-methylase UbiE